MEQNRITMLGTGNALVTRCYNTCFTLHSASGALLLLDAARLAEDLGVKNLILYHTEDKTLETRKKRYTTEAQSVFSDRVVVPDDLEIISL